MIIAKKILFTLSLIFMIIMALPMVFLGNLYERPFALFGQIGGVPMIIFAIYAITTLYKSRPPIKSVVLVRGLIIFLGLATVVLAILGYIQSLIGIPCGPLQAIGDTCTINQGLISFTTLNPLTFGIVGVLCVAAFINKFTGGSKSDAPKTGNGPTA